MGFVTESKLQVGQLAGIWHCRYWYPSTTHPGEDVSEYYVCIEHGADGYSLHSLPNRLEAYLQAHFTTDTNLATGTWLENTSPHGAFEGLLYGGVFQLIIADDQKRMSGAWVGVGRGGSQPKVYEGRWEIRYAGAELTDLPPL